MRHGSSLYHAGFPPYMARSPGERDRRESAAVIRLAAQAGAAVAEEVAVLGAGVVGQHLDRGEPEPFELVGDIAAEIEAPARLALRVAVGAEVAAVRRILGDEGRGEFRSDLVGVAGRCRGRWRRGCAAAARRASPSPRRSPPARRPIAPRQPAWAAPITPASASANSTGAQSAVRMPSAMPRVRVTMASAFGAVAGRPGLVDHGHGRRCGPGRR